MSNESQAALAVFIPCAFLGTIISIACYQGAYRQGQCDAVKGKYYYQLMHNTDGQEVWTEVKTPTDKPVVR